MLNLLLGSLYQGFMSAPSKLLCEFELVRCGSSNQGLQDVPKDRIQWAGTISKRTLHQNHNNSRATSCAHDGNLAINIVDMTMHDFVAVEIGPSLVDSVFVNVVVVITVNREGWAVDQNRRWFRVVGGTRSTTVKGDLRLSNFRSRRLRVVG